MKKYTKFFITIVSSAAILSSSTGVVKGMQPVEQAMEVDEEKVQKRLGYRSLSTYKELRKQYGDTNYDDPNYNIWIYFGKIWIDDNKKFDWDPVFDESLCEILEKLYPSSFNKGKNECASSSPLHDIITLIPCDGGTDATVNIFQVGETKLFAMKYFAEERLGCEEYNPAIYAYSALKANDGFKMARIRKGLKTVGDNYGKEPFLILYDIARGKTIYDILSSSEEASDKAIASATQYLAKFHIANWKNKKAAVYYISPDNLSNTRIRGDTQMIDGETLRKNIWEKITTKLGLLSDPYYVELRKDWDTIAKTNKIDSDKFYHYLSDFFELVVKENKESLDGEKSIITIVHGDTHLNNIFYDPTGNEGSFEKITLIDYSTMAKGPGDPGEDIGRFIGSLWAWAAEREKFSTNMESLYEQVYAWQEKIIEDCIKIWRTETKESKEFENYVKLFKINIKAYKQGYFRYVLKIYKEKNLNQKKENLLKLWWKEIQEKETIEIGLTKTGPTIVAPSVDTSKKRPLTGESSEERPAKIRKISSPEGWGFCSIL